MFRNKLRNKKKLANLSSKNIFFVFSVLFPKLDDFFFTFLDSFCQEESKSITFDQTIKKVQIRRKNSKIKATTKSF